MLKKAYDLIVLDSGHLADKREFFKIHLYCYMQIFINVIKLQ